MSDQVLPMKISEIDTPCLLVNKSVLVQNAERMLKTCKDFGVQLRPHMKTQKTLEIGKLMTGGTKRCISVSTINELQFFINGGFTDILLAIPITDNKLKLCQELLKEVSDLKLMFSSNQGLQCLINNPRVDNKPWSVVMEIDCGYGRTGIEWDSDDVIKIAVKANQSEHVDFMGLYTHCGDTYDAVDVKDICRINDVTCDRLVKLSNRLKEHGVSCRVVGTGSTPGCNNPTQNYSKLTELHPGCYIFNDYSMSLYGGCKLEDVALRVATRVIEHKVSKNYLIVDCGFLALSLDGIDPGYEEMCRFQDHPQLRLKGMTQELGKIGVVGNKQMDFSKYPIGTMLYIYPFHACHTSAMHPVYYIHEGDTVTNIYRPTRGW